ncbi:DC-STAMP domain-containing protein 2 isoform X1 [Astyanax mexicanus]|uniref:DC-STAMP domain-containing protein 2 isoform X1 n=1 Tax=Astyanax mexicanus TaxID=7994 RepID=UPI0020CB5DDE|nr:DC-STAMP domain-containing protein 2 isoform X1 [Astyanax mexicanus]
MSPRRAFIPSLGMFRKRLRSMKKAFKPVGKQLSWLLRSSAMQQAKRSLAGFFAGLFLSFLYGMTALYVQNYNLRFCFISTTIMALSTAVGMGLSSRVRANVTLMMPMLCTKEGKRFLLFLILTLVMQGPLRNTVENFERAAGSVTCGAELAMNQTRLLMQRAATPLLPVLSKIKEVSRNAYSLAGRVQNLITALTESVRHVSRSLRNVLHFLASIGDVCNDKMGTPYMKCNAVFNEGRGNCMEMLSVFDFLCHIVDGFRPLCGLMRVGEFFCILPSYIADHLKAKLAAPTIAAFNRMKKEFEFNMSASVHFDLDLNRSQSFQEMTQEIMQEVAQEQERFLELTAVLEYVGLFLLLYMYLQAVLYKNSYLHKDDFDNFYITEQFIEMDCKLSRQGRPAVLPLSEREALIYITPCSVRLTDREWVAIGAGLVFLLKHLVVGCVVIGLDLMVFWVFDMVHHQAQGEIVARAPMIVDVEVNGSGYASDIFKDIVTSFDILQRGNITILSKKCLMEPLEPDYMRYLFIGFLYGLAFFLVLVGSYAKRLQRFVCAHYHPQQEKKRILWLRDHMLSQRGSLGKALLRAVARGKADQGHSSVLQTLTRHLPGGATIAGFLGVFDKSCLACGKVMKGKDHPDVYTCATLNCTGSFCMQCFRVMGSICAVCMGPLTFQENSGEQELDSSDEEQVNLWETALTTPQPHFSLSSDQRKLMWRRWSVATGRPMEEHSNKEEQSGSCRRPVKTSPKDFKNMV